MIAERSSGPTRWIGSCLYSLLLVTWLGAPLSSAQEASPANSLAEQIDSAIQVAPWQTPFESPQAGQLLRRLHLDLVGVPPRLEEFEAYLADESPDRYQRAVEDLLGRPEFVEHWVDRFDLMLMERRPNTYIPQDQWRAWLHQQITSDRPLHDWLADLLQADGLPGDQRPAGRFLLDRDADPHLVTRDIGRIFFGRDLQCAQCHDHPLVDSYFQTDYHGILGFVAAISLADVREGEATLKVIAEKAAVEAPFESVFNRGTQRRVAPHLPGDSELAQVWELPGEQYDPPGKEGWPQRPKHSPRQQLAELIRSGQHRGFQENLANRIWSMLLGRGVVEPVDFRHAANPPRNPELLDALTNGLVEHGFHLRPFVRQIVLSNSYRRGAAPLRYDVVEGESSEFPTLLPGRPATPWLQELAERAIAGRASLTAAIESAKVDLETAEKNYETTESSTQAIEKQWVDTLAAVDAARNAMAQSVDARTKLAGEQVPLQVARDQAVDKSTKLKQAVEASQLALTAIGEDAELTAAVELLRQRLATAEAAVPPAEQALAAKTMELQSMETQINQQRDALLAAQTTADEVRAQRLPLREAANTARSQLADTEQKLVNLQRQELLAEHLIQCHELFSLPGETTNPSAIELRLADIAAQLTSIEATPATTPANDPIEARLAGINAAKARMESAKSQLEQFATELGTAQQELGGLRERQAAALTQLERMLSEEFLVTSLTPLTPEQIGWSTLHVTGVLDRYVDKHAAELEKEAPATAEQQADAGWLAQRHAQAVRRARAELLGNINTFVNLYGAGPGQPQEDFFATADQALFTSNGGAIFSWAAPAAGNVAQAIVEGGDATAAARCLYLGVLGRLPTTQEVSAVQAFLETAPDQRPRLAQEMVWSLMAGAEFRFNH